MVIFLRCLHLTRPCEVFLVLFTSQQEPPADRKKKSNDNLKQCILLNVNCSCFLSSLLYLGITKLLEDDLSIRWQHFLHTWVLQSTNLWQIHTGPALTLPVPSLRNLWLGKVPRWNNDCSLLVEVQHWPPGCLLDILVFLIEDYQERGA